MVDHKASRFVKKRRRLLFFLPFKLLLYVTPRHFCHVYNFYDSIYHSYHTLCKAVCVFFSQSINGWGHIFTSKLIYTSIKKITQNCWNWQRCRNVMFIFQWYDGHKPLLTNISTPGFFLCSYFLIFFIIFFGIKVIHSSVCDNRLYNEYTEYGKRLLQGTCHRRYRVECWKDWTS